MDREYRRMCKRMKRRFGFKSIRARIFTLIFPLTILSMLVLLLVSFQTAKGIINQEINDKMRIELDRTALSIKQILSEHSKIAEALARTVEVTGVQMEKEEYALLLQNALSMNNDTFGSGIWFEPNQYRPNLKYFGSYAYRDKDEIVYTEDYSTVEYDYPSWDWYKIGMNTKEKVVWSPTYVDGVSNVTMVTATAPFYNKDMQFMGVTTADINLTNVQKMILNVKVGTAGRAFLIDKNGLYLADEDSSKIMKVDVRQDSNQSLAAIGKVMMDSKGGRGEFTENNGSNIVYFKLLPDTGWVIALSISEKELYQPVMKLAYKLSALISAILISMIFISLLINDMLKPVMYLNRIVRQFGEKNMDVRCEINTKDEIGELGLSFNQMADIIQSYSMTLEAKVEERTKELNEKNIKIQDSIECAKMIQQAILPNDEEISKILKDYFVIWNPRDVVGGDLYWMKKFVDGYMIVVGDCTGHGVPGALMTMAVNAILDRIVDDMNHDDPAFVLNELSRLLNKTLRRGRTEANIQDGLDAGIIYVSNQGRILFSSAQISLFIVKDGRTYEIKGTNLTLGSSVNKKDRHFENQKIDFSPGMSFYIATDGIKDQVGGDNHLPYGKKALLTVLKSIQQCSMEEQKDIIWSTYEDYMKCEVLRDDVTMLGFKL